MTKRALLLLIIQTLSFGDYAYFGGGCFWCMEAPFEKLKGVRGVDSGYMGGTTSNPTYQDVTKGIGGHIEVVRVEFDSKLVSYEQLIETYWMNIDPTDEGGQFADRGSQYKTVIFYDGKEQRVIAQNSKKNLDACQKYDKPIATKILAAKKFYIAESYHQDYYKKNPIRYNTYKRLSGRTSYLEENASKPKQCLRRKEKVYKKPTKEELRKKLSPLEFEVTQNDGTERAFNNKYWDNKAEGIYVDVTTGEPLFSSKDKYQSGSGWPAFTKPIDIESIDMKDDNKLFMTRTEVRSKSGDSHLGHVFNDGPGPDGKRYCINSASLRFIPKEELSIQGYAKFEKLFNNPSSK